MTPTRHTLMRLAAAAIIAASALCACGREGDGGPVLDVEFNRSGYLGQAGPGKYLYVTAPGEWHLDFTYPEGTASWCYTSKPSGGASADGKATNVWVETGTNAAKQVRRATVTVTCGGQSVSRGLVQFGTDPPVLLDKMELPAITSTEWLLAYEDGQFMLDYSTGDKQAYWVAWQLHSGCIGSIKRPAVDPWAYDGRVPEQYWPAQNEFGGYQRGHLCPAGDRTRSLPMYNETFYYTNVSPQIGSLNTGAWLQLENLERDWIKNSRFDTLFICAGGMLSSETLRKQAGVLTVPGFFFKAVLGRKGDAYEAIGFWFANSGATPANVTASNTHSIRDLEQKTGFNFFYNLPEAVQTAVENRKDPGKWGL
jgi:endonuclease G